MRQKPKVQPTFKLADNFLNLRQLDTNVIIEQLEENIRRREMPLESHIRKSKKQDKDLQKQM